MRTVIAAIILLIIGAAPADAQDAVASTQRETGIVAPALFAQTPTTGQATNGINVGPLRNVKFSGLVQVWYQAGDEGFVDTFRVRRTELYVGGEVTSRGRFLVMLDPSKALSVNAKSSLVNGAMVTEASINQASRILQDAYISLTVAPHLDVQMGQFKVPLNLEGLASSYALPLVERSLITTDRARGGAFGDIRDIGVMARGTFANGLEYRVGVFDGLGTNQNDVDKDDHKTVAGRLAYKTPVKGLQIGGFGATDKDSATRLERNRMGIDVQFIQGPVLLQAEWVRGKDGALVRRGYYATVGYKVRPKAEVVFRYDTLDPDTHSDATSANVAEHDYDFGFNGYLSGNFLKWQVEYLHKTFAGGLSPARNVFLAHLQVSW